MIEPLSILFGAIFAVAVCAGMGRMVLRWSRAPLYREEEYPLALVTGASLVHLIVLGLSLLGLLYSGVLLAAGGAVLAAATLTGAWRRSDRRLPELSRFWRYLFGAVLAIFGFLYFSYAMAPELSPDGSSYHLGFVNDYLRDHRMAPTPHNMYGMLSQGIEMLFLLAFAFGKHSAAALVHFAFLLSMPVAMLSYARRFGFAKAGVVGAIFFFASPVVGMDGSTAYNDVATSTVIFALYYLLHIWAESGEPRLLAPIGFVSGFTYACKYTAGLAIPFAIGFVAWTLWRRNRPWFRAVLVVGLCAFVMFAPWIARNFAWYCNPFAPLLNALFPNPYIHISFETGYSANMRSYGLDSLWGIPLDVTVYGQYLCGILGPLFLLTPLALLAWREKHGRVLLFAGLVFGLTYAGNIGTRFLIPALPYFALALGLVFTRIPRLGAALAIAHVVLSWPSFIGLYSHPYCWRIDTIRIKQALRIEDQDHYARRRSAEYVLAREIDKVVPPGEKVFAFSGVSDSYTDREILVGYQSAHNEVLNDILWMPLKTAGQSIRHWKMEFPARKVRKLRVVQTQDSPNLEWSIGEFRVFHNGGELAREAGWRLRCEPNGWWVQLAFDNSPVTRWRSRQVMEEGMFMEVDFGAARLVDSVLLECSYDQPDPKLRLEAMTPEGDWKTLTEECAESLARVPVGQRRLATRELKRAGVNHILTKEGEFLHEDFIKHPSAWGVTCLFDMLQRRFYRID